MHARSAYNKRSHFQVSDPPIQMSTKISVSVNQRQLTQTNIYETKVKNIFDIYVTEYGTALTTILPILFLYLNTVTVTAGAFEP